jgi:2-oxoglutarate ferredoxin oxidoreductase subunit beta
MESCAQKKKSYKAKDYKSDLKPIWCPGCGDYTVLNSITRALAELALPPEEVAVVSGIGCSSRIPAYTSVYGFHGVHGRALPVATGLKLARPDLTVLVTGGDGDGFSIGGNHFLHACRRNVDLTYIVMDNQVYGMTKGQASPTTAPDWEGSKLTPEGTGINPFQPLVVGLASGANFIARVSASDPINMAQIIVEAIRHPGLFAGAGAEPLRHLPPRAGRMARHRAHGRGRLHRRRRPRRAPPDDRRRLQRRQGAVQGQPPALPAGVRKHRRLHRELEARFAL